MIIVMCPANCFTGGPTLLHQFARRLLDRGIPVRMAYYLGAGSKTGHPVHPNYQKYSIPHMMIHEIVDKPGDCVVAPETAVNTINRFEHLQKVVWWLSVDNYILSTLGLWGKIVNRLMPNSDVLRFVTRRTKNRPIFQDCNIIHLWQSEYAAFFLDMMGVNKTQTYRMSDFIDEFYLQHSRDETSSSKEDIVLYNPRKMGRVVQELLSRKREYLLVPLEGMSPERLYGIMSKAKVYVDFGPHPGKDRLPRETAAFGCCVVTGLRGSARFDNDVPIPRPYKVDDGISAYELDKLLTYICFAYQSESAKFEDYRQIISMEPTVFDTDLEKVIEVLGYGDSHGG